MNVKDIESLEFKSLKEEQTNIILAEKLKVPNYMYLFCLIIIILLVVIWWVF